MSDGKPCVFCGVGWMGRWRARVDGVWFIVWLCHACGRQTQEREA